MNSKHKKHSSLIRAGLTAAILAGQVWTPNAQSTSMTIKGAWPSVYQLHLTSVQRVGTLLYTTSLSEGLVIFDVSDPINPFRRGSYHTTGSPAAVGVDGSTAYLQEQTNGLQIIDVSNPDKPVRVGGIQTPGNVAQGYATHVYAKEGLAYVADGTNGLQIVDVRNPANPMLRGSFAFGTSSAATLEVIGTTAYVGVGGSLRIVDVTDPGNPRQLGMRNGGGGINSVKVVGNLAFLAVGQAGVSIVDISDPANGAQVAKLTTLGSAYDVRVAGNYVFAGTAAYGTNGAAGLEVFDVSDLTHATNVAHLETGVPLPPSIVVGLEINGNVIYAADVFGGLSVIDVTTPSSPFSRGPLLNDPKMQSLQVVSNMVYTIGPPGLQAFDVRDPVRPIRKGFFELPGFPTGLAVRGTLAYTSGGSLTFKVIDISDLTHMRKVGELTTDGFPKAIWLEGNLAYVTLEDSAGLEIIDVSDPANPQRRSSIMIGIGRTAGIQVVNNLAYIATDLYGLVVVDVSNPAAPTILLRSQFGTSSTDVTVVGQRAFVAGYGAGLQIFDVSNPSSPVLIGANADARSAGSIQINGNRAYLAGGRGLVVMDVSNPTNPVVMGSYSTGGSFSAVKVDGAFAYVLDSINGMAVIDLNAPMNTILRLSPQVVNGGLSLSIPAEAVSGRTFRVESTPVVPRLSWTTVTGLTITGDNPKQILIPLSAQSTQSFYRAVLLP